MTLPAETKKPAGVNRGGACYSVGGVPLMIFPAGALLQVHAGLAAFGPSAFRRLLVEAVANHLNQVDVAALSGGLSRSLALAHALVF